ALRQEKLELVLQSLARDSVEGALLDRSCERRASLAGHSESQPMAIARQAKSTRGIVLKGARMQNGEPPSSEIPASSQRVGEGRRLAGDRPPPPGRGSGNRAGASPRKPSGPPPREAARRDARRTLCGRPPRPTSHLQAESGSPSQIDHELRLGRPSRGRAPRQ